MAISKKTAVEKDVIKTTEKESPKKKDASKGKEPSRKKEPKTAVVIEYMGSQINSKTILTDAAKAFSKANKGVEIKTLDLYVKPEEGVAYYVVNGLGSDDFKISL